MCLFTFDCIPIFFSAVFQKGNKFGIFANTALGPVKVGLKSDEEV